MSVTEWLWVLFAAMIAVILWLDLGFLNRKKEAPSLRSSITWSLVWVAMALLFNAAIWLEEGSEPALTFLTAYLIERSLQIDNLFVFMLVFNYFRVPAPNLPRVLFWGIVGAVVLETIFILFGIALLRLFHWVIYVFGVLLLYSAYRMLRGKDEDIDPGSNPVVRAVRNFMPVTDSFEGDRFFVRRPNRQGRQVLMATPVVLVVVAIGISDLVFAIDSIPAVLSISTDYFIILTSNILAVMGLRVMYFAIASFVGMFRFLSHGLALVLAFVGLKLLSTDFLLHYFGFELPIIYSLLIVLGILGVAVAVSIILPQTKGAAGGRVAAEPPAPDK